MREIEFRAKRKSNGEWVYGNLFIPDLETAETQICIGTPTVRITYDVDPDTIGQFTGLKDKVGNRIFEDDVINEVCSLDGTTTSIHVVEFAEERGGWYPFASGDGCGCCENSTITPAYSGIVDRVIVVGNIHDNPELAEVCDNDD